MSAATDDAAAGSAATTDTQGAGSGMEPTGEDTSSRGYLERVKTDPDFATEQVRSHQSRADTLGAEKKKLEERVGNLNDYLDRYSGDQLAQNLKLLESLAKDPSGFAAIQEFQASGTFTVPGAKEVDVTTSETDEYKTPEEIEIEALKANQHRLESELGQMRGHNSRNALLDHLEKFYGEYDVAPDARKQLAKDMGDLVEAWKSQGDAGKAALENLMNPSSYESTFRGVALGRLDPGEVAEAAQRAKLRKEKGLSALSTDSPSGRASSGAEAPPEFKSAVEAFAYAQEHADELGGGF